MNRTAIVFHVSKNSGRSGRSVLEQSTSICDISNASPTAMVLSGSYNERSLQQPWICRVTPTLTGISI